MKLQKISTKIAEKIRIAKLERREAQVKKYLSFELQFLISFQGHHNKLKQHL